jgi:hypothetical protein
LAPAGRFWIKRRIARPKKAQKGRQHEMRGIHKEDGAFASFGFF